jgi:hypothetical protein
MFWVINKSVEHCPGLPSVSEGDAVVGCAVAVVNRGVQKVVIVPVQYWIPPLEVVAGAL